MAPGVHRREKPDAGAASSRRLISPGRPGLNPGEFHSVEQILGERSPEGARPGQESPLRAQRNLVETLRVPAEAQAIADKHDFDMTISQFKASDEDARDPRVVRFGVTQNSISVPTDAPVQSRSILVGHSRKFCRSCGCSRDQCAVLPGGVDHAFAFCTREKLPWTNFAECAETGPTTKFLQQLTRRHNMVLVSPILGATSGTEALCGTRPLS